MPFWIGLAVLGFVVTVLIVESRPVRRRLEKRAGSDISSGGGFWAGSYGGGSDGGGSCGDGGFGGGC
jgi:hypothetical protein